MFLEKMWQTGFGIGHWHFEHISTDNLFVKVQKFELYTIITDTPRLICAHIFGLKLCMGSVLLKLKGNILYYL